MQFCSLNKDVIYRYSEIVAMDGNSDKHKDCDNYHHNGLYNNVTSACIFIGW